MHHYPLYCAASKSLSRSTSHRASPVHKLLGNFSATLCFFSHFQFAGQLSVHRAASKFLYLDSHSHAPATSEILKECRIYLVSRIYLSNLLVLLLGSTCFYEKASLRNKRL